MNVQNSFEASSSGVLYVVPTPIGNLEDITYRALSVLQSVTIIAAEDTRHTKKLLNHFDIKTPLISYHEHNKKEREEALISRLKQGETIAVVSDAGMPAISDPGHDLVVAAIQKDLSVVVLPGANAALCALVGSGLPASAFTFIGFLPRKTKEKVAELERLKQHTSTLIFYESPYRVKDTLSTIESVFGDRHIAIARELTKKYEQFVRGTVRELVDWMDTHPIKGECCIVVEGAHETSNDTESMWWASYTIKAHVDHYIVDEQMSSKSAIKQAALDRNIPKRDVYQAYHID
ncbi:16S rRNA (cytidine(1402)-2'-O)-methyltransferase [Lentibacillus saliphilus]|uniref:16S rRNA (cytidine(1402)-2'-O)-methyltransferase n=1 Tax=Lentibacillus saliphilus TaxID=2737028 RepID=UPI001C303433|nr:16S rRNA (cytidine(1402)-2'-O)-methyltransferase [Lentibacillus saliphilus]